MRLVVVGADSGVGRQLLEQGLGHGHEIVAVAEDGQLALSHERLRVLAADARDRDAIADAARDAEAAFLTLPVPPERPPVGLLPEATSSVVSALKLVRVRRLVALSAAGVGESREGLPLAYGVRVATSWRQTFAELAQLEEIVLFSGLEWTLLRPAALNDGPLTGLYRVRDNVLPERGKQVSRADVAALMLKALSSQRYIERIIAVAD